MIWDSDGAQCVFDRREDILANSSPGMFLGAPLRRHSESICEVEKGRKRFI